MSFRHSIGPYGFFYGGEKELVGLKNSRKIKVELGCGCDPSCCRKMNLRIVSFHKLQGIRGKLFVTEGEIIYEGKPRKFRSESGRERGSGKIHHFFVFVGKFGKDIEKLRMSKEYIDAQKRISSHEDGSYGQDMNLNLCGFSPTR